jgi:DNA segregation ATPase FtsK/SpoIIIE, S-DNA-T family
MSDNTTNNPIEPVGSEESNVHYLPARRATGHDGIERTAIEPAGPVLEGEIVTAQEYNARQKAAAIERYKGYRRDAVTVYRGAKTVLTHQRTKTVVRHTLAYPVAGAGVVWRRWRDAHGGNRYERQMRAAEAAGDQEALRYWQEANVAEKQRRHSRVMDWLSMPGKWIKAGIVGILGLAGFLLVLGVILAINSGAFSDVIGPITAVFNAVAFVVWFLTTYGMLLILGGTTASLFYLYAQGRTHAEMPPWLATPTSGDGDVMDGLPDESTIVNALRNLNIAGFKTALKEGWRVRFRQVPHVDGKGWRAQLDLPPACSVEEIVKRKTMLAHNLVRYPIEVWPTEPQPSVLDLWVANPGALSGPIEPWPLLADLDNTTCDYFTGVPAGVTIKGDVVRGRLSEANYVVGGMMGSGKSSLVITLILGAMLDPLVDIDVVVMAENADYEPMRRRLRSLVTGAGEETVQTCLTMLYALYEELSLRGKALREHDARAVTRKLAEKDKRLRPRIMVIDECQNLFIGEHGKAAIEVASKLMSTARKYAITLLFLTPEPSKDAYPRKITAIASNKACFAIGDQQANDAVLGTGSYKSGISAVGLTPKTDDGPGDVGTCMQRGFTGLPGLLRSFFVAQDDAHRVTDRAMQLRDQHGITTSPVEVEPVEQRDPLADIATVLGDAPRMKTMDVLQRLVELHRPTYQDWTARTLTAFLTDHHAEPYKTAGAMQISAARIHEALTVRDENEGDDTA